MTGEQLDGYLARFATDVLLDAFRFGEAAFWRRRAEDFERAKPVPGEFHGQSTREELSAAWRRCDEVARACRLKADLLERDRATVHGREQSARCAA